MGLREIRRCRNAQSTRVMCEISSFLEWNDEKKKKEKKWIRKEQRDGVNSTNEFLIMTAKSSSEPPWYDQNQSLNRNFQAKRNSSDE